MLGGAVVSPPDGGQDPRWAQPRPPAEKARLQGYPRNSGVAGLSLKPILAEKSVQRHVAGEHLERPRELPKLENPPNSAREPAKERKPPKASGALTARGRVEGTAGRLHDHSTFLRMLLDFGDVVLDDKSLQKLEAQVANAKQAEIVKVLKQLNQELSAGTPSASDPSRLPTTTSMELDQLTAQAAFLEKKILKLREKLKRQARDSSQPPEGSPEAAQLEQLATELEGLRAQKLRLEAEREAIHHTMGASGSNSSLHGRRNSRDEAKEATSVKAHLQKKLLHLQSQTKERTIERDAADHTAEEARKLAETVEERLRDMLLTRESERVKLEAEQELLRRKVQEQEKQIQEMEARPGDVKELQSLREHIAELEQTLSETRQKRAELANQGASRPRELATASRLLELQETQTPLAGSLTVVQQSTGSDPAPGESTAKPEPQDELPFETTLQPAESTSSGAAAARPASGAAETASLPADTSMTRPTTGAVESSLQAESVEAAASSEAGEGEELQLEQLRLQLASLDKELDRIRAEGRRTEYQQRREFGEILEQKRTALSQELKSFEVATSSTEDNTSLLKDVETSLEKLDEQQEEELKKVNREAEEQTAAMEREYKALEAELGQDPYQHDLVARRQRELSGRCMLALRPADYRREEALHYICCTLELPNRQVEVIEESCIVDGECYTDLLNAKTQPLPAAGTLGLDDLEPEARPLIKLTLNILASDRTETSHRARAAHAQRLMGLVCDGGSLLEDVAVVSANYLRGISALDAEGEKWCEEEAEYVTATSRTIGDRNLHITVHQHAEPLVVRVVAIEHSKGEEYMVCFDDNDLSALLGEASLMRKQPELRIVDHLLDALRILEGPAGFPILVALQVSQAPQTVLNGLQGSDEAAFAQASPALADLTAPTEWLQSQSRDSIEKIKADEVVFAIDNARPMFEDVMMLNNSFFTLTVFEDVITRTLRVRLQESSCCEAVEAVLPGRTEGGLEFRQLRMHAEAFEFRGTTVLLLVEDLDVPPGILIRVADGGSVWSKEVRVASDHCVYHLVEVTDDDGSLSYLPHPVARQGATISAINSQHREHLRMFAESDIPMPQADKQRGDKTLPMIGHRELQTEDGATVLRISDMEAVIAASARTQRAEQATRRLQAKSDQTGGRLLLKMGRRLSMPGGESTLCVLTFVEKEAPILHIALTAHELSTCRSWFLAVDSLAAFKALGVRLQGGAADYANRRSLAHDLAAHCCLTAESNGTLGLKIRADESAGETGKESSASGDAAPVTALGIAKQELSQEEAARWIDDDSSYCMAAAALQMSGVLVEVYIYDEPAAESIVFSLNNFLVLAHDTHRDIFFSMRLHDKVLAYPLQDGEQHLLEPEHHTDLLWRVLVSLDLCDSVDQHGMSGERLVMQQEAVRRLPDLLPDAAGVLRPEGMRPVAGLKALPNKSTADKLELDALAPVVAIGSWQGETGAESRVAAYATRSQMSSTSEAMLGEVAVQLSIFTDDKAGSYIFKLVASNLPDECLEVQMPLGGDPTRIYLENRSFLGSPLAIAMSERAFPHELHVAVFDPRSQHELQLTARSETIQPLVERSLRARLCDALETLMRDGALSQAGKPLEWREVSCGRELFPPDVRERYLQTFSPILVLPLHAKDAAGQKGCTSSVEVVFACTRYILDMSIVPDIALLDEQTLATVPLLRITLLKDLEVPELTLRIEGLANCGDGARSHTIRARYKGTNSPTGAYAEMQRLGDLRFAFLFLDDAAPRAFRVVVLELTTGWSLQMLVLETPDPSSTYLSQSSPRLELLRLFRSSVSVRRGVLGASSSKWDGGAGLARRAAAPGAAQTALLQDVEAQPQTLPPQRSLLAKAQESEKRVLRREARFVDGAEDAVLLTLRTLPEASGLSLSLSQPLSGKETHLDVANAIMKKLMHASRAGNTSIAEALQDDSLRDELATTLLQATEVRPPLEICVNLDKIRSEALSPEEAAPEALPPVSDEQPSAEVVNEPGPHEVQADRLLAEVDKRYHQSQPDASADGMPSLRAQVYDCSNSVTALFNSTNLRVRVTDLNTGRAAIRDFHEKELLPWLAEADAEHLLVASREADLVDAVMWHAMLPEPRGPEATAADGITLCSLTPEIVASGRYAKGFLESTST